MFWGWKPSVKGHEITMVLLIILNKCFMNKDSLGFYVSK